MKSKTINLARIHSGMLQIANRQLPKILFSLFILSALLMSCRDDEAITEQKEEETTETKGIEISTPDWTIATHSDSLPPNYDMVFKENEVIRIDLKIDATAWATMQADLKSNVSGSSRPGGTLVEFDPVWVAGSVFYNGKEWYKVGIRYKGNSSLSSAYQSGISKLSFKLDFDQFESTYPAIKNQRFYGFKQLNLKNNFSDKAFIREKVAADLFREFGLASSRTSFCQVYVDNGTGSKYFGLYSLVEEVDDTVLDSQYADGSGNLYKPDGTAASFAANSFNESQMVKQTNEDLNDFTDVRTLYTVLNSSTRTSSPATWKTELEKSLDVDIFMKWLAANTTIQNWDTYGIMTHNYYLYNNPATGKLNWIPWDGNEAFQTGKQSGALALAMTSVSSSWPLIRYLIDVPEYKTKYKDYLKQFTTTVFTAEKLNALYTSYYNLLKESAYAETSGYSFLSSKTEFDSAISTLKTHASGRVSAVNSYLLTN